jgi:uncharacterized integral membrane protein (TIGR00698 family)
VSAAAPPGHAARPAWVPGVALAVGAGLLALGLGTLQQRWLGQPLVEPLVLALLIGVIARNIVPAGRVPSFGPGASIAARPVLEVGVALLGASLSAAEVLRAGPALAALILGGVAAAIAVGFLIGRALSLGVELALLVAVGNAICGNSAIAALAPVIRAKREDVASAIGLTAVIGLGVVLGLPLLIGPLALGHRQYGVLAGMSVYAVPQVVAAAFPVSQLSGEVATLVKLTRVLMLGPVVLLAGLLFRGGSAGRTASTYPPWFVLAFLGLAALRSVGLLPDAVAAPTREASRLLTIVAMAGLGFGVELGAVRRVGPRVALAVVASLAFMIGSTLALLRVVGLDG